MGINSQFISKNASVDNLTIGTNGDGQLQSLKDEFTYFDDTTLSNTGTTETLVRTYTFNKAVDFLKLTASLRTSDSNVGYMSFYKNGVKIPASSVLDLGFYASGTNFSQFVTTTNYIQAVKVGTTTNNAIILYFNTSFAIGDTFEIKLDNAGASSTTYTDLRVLEGFNKKNNDTTYVSLS